MPTCKNCGSAVSKQYIRVFALPQQQSVRCCPRCDRIRDGTTVRDARNTSGR